MFADRMKAQDIVILDMRRLVNFCDYFVIATGTSAIQVKAIAEGIEEKLSQKGITTHFNRGLKAPHDLPSQQQNGTWLLLDIGEVVVHIFEPRTREFYGLEHLWQDAVKIEYIPHRKKKS